MASSCGSPAHCLHAMAQICDNNAWSWRVKASSWSSAESAIALLAVLSACIAKVKTYGPATLNVADEAALLYVIKMMLYLSEVCGLPCPVWFHFLSGIYTELLTSAPWILIS